MIREKIRFENRTLKVPAFPIIPYIEGDGVGPDIWKATKQVINTAVEIAYGGEKRIFWKQVYAGEKAFKEKGEWLPTQTLDAFEEHIVALKGPLAIPAGGGIGSLNIALRQELDLYASVRPVKYYQGDPSRIKYAEQVDLVLFHENTGNIKVGMERHRGTPEAEEEQHFLMEEIGGNSIRFPDTVSRGVKPVFEERTRRLVEAAIEYAIVNKRDSVTIVYKDTIMKYTEGQFKEWGYHLAQEEFGATAYDDGPWLVIKKNTHQIIVKDITADAFLQQISLSPAQYDVIATLNLQGDEISDALAALAGGIGIAPGANINYHTGVALFGATHGSTLKYTGQDINNLSSEILSGVMMLEYIGWYEAAHFIVRGLEGAIADKTGSYDFARLREGATLLKCSAFGKAIIKHM